MSEFFVEPDFSEVQDQVEPGIYKTRVVAVKPDEWAANEKRAAIRILAWTLETFGENVDKNNGRKIFHRTPIHGKGAFRLRDFYKAVMGEDLQAGKPFDPNMLMGRECEVTLVQQKDEPQYTEIKLVKKLAS